LVVWKKQRRGVVSVVTGAGKTAFAELCMLTFREQYPDARFVIVVPTAALLDQWYISLGEDLGIQESEIGCYSGQDHPKQPALVNLLVVNTARTEASRVSESTPSFLIVDECHPRHRMKPRRNPLERPGRDGCRPGGRIESRPQENS
jgi:superfamily II DNA or RNA helicase